VNERITITCPACGNRMAVGPEHAGRDGWCPACKRVFTAPGPGTRAYEDAEPGERHKRLERLFQFAATRVDACRRDLNQALSENRALLDRLEAMDAALDRLAALEQRFDALQAAVERIETAPPDEATDREVLTAIARTEVDAVQHAIEDRLRRSEAQMQEAIAGLRSDRDDVTETIGALQERIQGLREEVDEIVAGWQRLRESAERAAKSPVSADQPLADRADLDEEDESPALRAVVAPDAPESSPLLQSLLRFMDAEDDESDNE